jgi:hypothetical protein
MSKRGYHLNATGRELPVDMACPSTIEPFKLDKDAEEFFYDELNTLPLSERVERIIGVFERNKQLVGSLIVENNDLGRALMERLPGEQFVSSVKRPGSTLHWMYSIVDRMKAPPSDEWLKEAIDTVKGSERDFVNVWTGKGPAPQGEPNHQPMAEIVNPHPRPFNGSSQMDTGIEDVSRQGVSVNIGAMPTDEDFKGLDALTKDGILDTKLEVPLDPMEMMREQVVVGRINAAVERATEQLRNEMRTRVSQLEVALSDARLARGNLADEIFEVIKHGDQKHQDWLQAALRSFFLGLRPLTEEQVAQQKENYRRIDEEVSATKASFQNAAPLHNTHGTEDRSAFDMRLPTNVQWVDEKGKPKP